MPDIDQNTAAAAVARVRELREAFVAGGLPVVCPKYCAAASTCPACAAKRTTLAEEAARRYPMPTVEVPRVVCEPHGGVAYKIDTREDGLRVLYVSCASFTGGAWKTITDAPHSMDTSRLAMIASLLANPTVQYPADKVQDE